MSDSLLAAIDEPLVIDQFVSAFDPSTFDKHLREREVSSVSIIPAYRNALCALHVSCRKRRHDNLKYLLTFATYSCKPVDINYNAIHEYWSGTAFHQCLSDDNWRGLKLLVDFGADSSIADLHQLTPVEKCRRMNFQEMKCLNLLENYRPSDGEKLMSQLECKVHVDTLFRECNGRHMQEEIDAKFGLIWDRLYPYLHTAVKMGDLELTMRCFPEGIVHPYSPPENHGIIYKMNKCIFLSNFCFSQRSEQPKYDIEMGGKQFLEKECNISMSLIVYLTSTAIDSDRQHLLGFFCRQIIRGDEERENKIDEKSLLRRTSDINVLATNGVTVYDVLLAQKSNIADELIEKLLVIGLDFTNHAILRTDSKWGLQSCYSYLNVELAHRTLLLCLIQILFHKFIFLHDNEFNEMMQTLLLDLFFPFC